MIRDDAERRGIDVCEGAIGWLDKHNDVEILCIYDEFVPVSGLQFIPAPECDAIYYVDHFDRTKFIRTDTIFHKTHEEKLAELRNVAFCLGAKSCSIDISESESEADSAKRKASTSEGLHVGIIKASAGTDIEQSSAHKNVFHNGGHSESKWSGDQERVRPELKWFRHEETILKLIDSCLSGTSYVQSEFLVLEGSSFATMSHKAAVAVDAAASKSGVGANSKNTNSMEAQASKESRSKLIFHIEF
ncbi:MAG: hypothetical protein J6I98_00955 [Clostridia bacterium]|nr:hypothetical protein [Clostridia bacterium]